MNKDAIKELGKKLEILSLTEDFSLFYIQYIVGLCDLQAKTSKEGGTCHVNYLTSIRPISGMYLKSDYKVAILWNLSFFFFFFFFYFASKPPDIQLIQIGLYRYKSKRFPSTIMGIVMHLKHTNLYSWAFSEGRVWSSGK